MTTRTKSTYKSYNKQRKHRFKLHIAIDFGTDGTAMAYAYGNKVFIHDKWSSRKYGHEIKQKTVILLDNKGNTLGFGLDSKLNYISNPQHKHEWLLFEHFKMSLYENEMHNRREQINISNELIAANGIKFCSDFIFIAAFKYIQLEAFKFLKSKKIKNIKMNEIQWIITVPAIWNDKSKYKMKEWAIKSGLQHTKIVYEPDCASLSIQYQMYYEFKNKLLNNKLNKNKNKNKINNNKHLQIGDIYILIDAGGGTVDIVCHQILGTFGVKEISFPSGGPWGSTYIDKQYIKLLYDIFTKKWIQQFKYLYPNIYIELLYNFVLAKSIFFNDVNKQWHNVRLPTDFICFIEEKIDEMNDKNIKQIEDMVANAKLYGFSNLVLFEGEYIQINITIWRLMFDNVINPIILHIKQLLNTKKMFSYCKSLCLVGGLSCSKYFQYKINKYFGAKSKYKLIIIIPKRPKLSVVEGAVYFGIIPNYIRARILKKTYGIKASFTEKKAKLCGINKKHILNNKLYIKYYKGYFIKNCFKVLGRKNTQVRNNEIIKYSFKRQPKCTIAKVKIICSDMEYPTVINDGIVLAQLNLEFDNNNNNNIDDKNIELEFHFYDTQLKVIAYIQNEPNNKKEVEITYINTNFN